MGVSPRDAARRCRLIGNPIPDCDQQETSMASTRRQKLEAMLRDDPDDVFLRSADGDRR